MADKEQKFSMSVNQFEIFLNTKQRDPRLNELVYPYCTYKQAADTIQKFEIDETFRKKSIKKKAFDKKK